MASGTKPNTHLILNDAELEYCREHGGKSKVIHAALAQVMADTGIHDATLDEMDAIIGYHALRVVDIVQLRTRYGIAQGKTRKNLLTTWGDLRREVTQRGGRVGVRQYRKQAQQVQQTQEVQAHEE